MKKLICIGLSLIMVLCLFSGCAAEKESVRDYAYSTAAPMEGFYEDGALNYKDGALNRAEDFEISTESSKEQTQSVAANRKLIRKLSDVEQIEHFTGFGLYDRTFVEVLRSLEDPMPHHITRAWSLSLSWFCFLKCLLYS